MQILINNKDIILLENFLGILGIDNFDVERRRDNSRLKWLGTRFLSDAEADKLVRYYNHLVDKYEEVANGEATNK